MSNKAKDQATAEIKSESKQSILKLIKVHSRSRSELLHVHSCRHSNKRAGFLSKQKLVKLLDCSYKMYREQSLEKNGKSETSIWKKTNIGPATEPVP